MRARTIINNSTNQFQLIYLYQSQQRFLRVRSSVATNSVRLTYYLLNNMANNMYVIRCHMPMPLLNEDPVDKADMTSEC